MPGGGGLVESQQPKEFLPVLAESQHPKAGNSRLVESQQPKEFLPVLAESQHPKAGNSRLVESQQSKAGIQNINTQRKIPIEGQE